ncbi:hypothetical protein [Paraburkholderia sp. BL23I1N1]|uniref:hypothetical protein n=1 Tax=Paraburkholderia sp. BL23I1N1 TaxID=1938802 RepID=UPI0011C4343C|nr:hypothetical protein [Paraburkholderia sp. BL23I1N1]
MANEPPQHDGRCRHNFSAVAPRLTRFPPVIFICLVACRAREQYPNAGTQRCRDGFLFQWSEIGAVAQQILELGGAYICKKRLCNLHIYHLKQIEQMIALLFAR